MSHPQHQLRVYLDDGPYRGETLSIARTAGGDIPSHITIGGEHTAHGPVGLTEHREAADAHGGRVSYRFDHADMDNGLWVYQTASDTADADLDR
jgi:hypothetical protein